MKKRLLIGAAILAANSLQHGQIYAGLQHPQAEAMLTRAFGHGVAPSDGRLLYDLIVAKGYRRALDLDKAKGYAALWFALAVRKTGGKLTTIEIEPNLAGEAHENFRRAGLDDVIDSRTGNALLEIPAIPGQFDFVFIDLGVPLNMKLLGLLNARISPGGAVAAHNACTFPFTQPDFLSAIQNDSALDTKLIPTLSGGISITIWANH